MTGSEVRRMRLRFDGTCDCRAQVPAGTDAGYLTVLKAAVCPDCLASLAGPTPRERHRRNDKRSERSTLHRAS